MTSRPEDAAARRARHRDTVISALIAAAAVLTLVLTTDERGLRRLFVVVFVAGGVSNAILSARRAGWRWAEAWPHLLLTILAIAIVYILAWATGR